MAGIAIETGCDWNAYFDESYGNVDGYVVAGYVAPVEQWLEAVRELRELGKEEGFTVLHKRVLEHNVKGSEFEWPNLTKPEKDAKRKRINSRVCGIIKRRASAGFTAAVTKSTWEAEVRNTPWAEALGSSFYAAGVYICMNLISVWAERFNRHDRVLYILEDDAIGKGEARRILEESKKAPRLRDRFLIHGFTFEDKADPDFVPLQFADFLAYEAYRQLDNRIIEGIKRPERGAMRCLLYRDDPQYEYAPSETLPTPLFAAYLNEKAIRETLEGLRTNFPEGPGERC